METRFNPLLVGFSILVAIFASYVALNLAQSVTRAKGRAQALWLACGALAMGIGIWSMHFVGMLAFEMPGMTIAYDIPLMLLSVGVAIAASALALFIVSRSIVPISSIIAGGIAMAAAIAGMHYIGMYSMRMAAEIHWNAFFVVLSILIALGASFSALLILTRLRNKPEHFAELLIAAIVMGFAISGMHYMGMAAASFIHKSDVTITDSNLLVSSGLSIAVITTTLMILGLALGSSVSERLWNLKNKEVNEILVSNEEKFRRLVDAVKDYAIFMLDTTGHITTWNLGAMRITGYSSDEILGKHISIFYSKADIDNHTAEKELSEANEMGHFESECQRIKKDGSIYWANVVISPLYDQEGTITGYSKVVRDITQFKESERRLKTLNEDLESRVASRTRDLARRENQLHMITNAVPVLIAQLDTEERFTFANDAFCNWFGRSNATIIGRSFAEILGAERYKTSIPNIKQALSGEMMTFERDSESVKGVSVIFNITFVPEFDQKRKVTGFIIVATDITAQKEIQLQLKNAKEAAEVANATKSAFLANMSHEIRTPLGAVLGFSELLLNGEMSPSERLNSAEIIKRNGRLLSNIINDILDLSKVEAGKLEVEKVNVPFSEVMKEIGSVLNLEATAKGIDLKVTSDGFIPTQIKTDPLRLRQILINIVGNAIKFTKRGSVNVKVKLITASDNQTKLSFVIQDTGEGIKPEQAERLFMPFTQADPSTTRKFGGTGLGLVLSKKLANALGGDVVLTETTPGSGSTFTVTIDPGISEQILFQSSENRSAIIQLPIVKRPFNLHLLKVLLVDDSIDNQLLIKKIIRLAGAEVETASNGREGVRKALEGNFHLILMDLQMPEMDGYEATKILREQGYKKPIIALTAHALKEERQRTLHSGFNAHLVKPVDQQLLVETLASYSTAIA